MEPVAPTEKDIQRLSVASHYARSSMMHQHAQEFQTPVAKIVGYALLFTFLGALLGGAIVYLNSSSTDTKKSMYLFAFKKNYISTKYWEML